MVTVKSQPSGNTQVSEEAKEIVYSKLEDYGVRNARDLLLHWYNDGDFVCLSYNEEFEGENLRTYMNARKRIVASHPRNSFVEDNFGTIWIHREWIEQNS